MTNDTPVTALQKLLVSNQHQIELALPKHLRPERLIRLAVTALKTSPGLQNCSLLSICNSVMLSAQLGLEINNGLGHGWLIPYKNQCTFQPGYRGLLELAYRTGLMRDCRPIVVYEKELFHYQEGADPLFRHSPLPPRVRGTEWIGAYSRLTMADGRESIYWMWREEIEEIRDKCSVAAKKTVDKQGNEIIPIWTKWFWEMVKKTVIKRHLKMERLSSDVALAVGLDDQAEAHAAQDSKLSRFQVAQDLVLENGLVDQAIEADDQLEGSRADQDKVAQEILEAKGHADAWGESVREVTIKLINSKKFPTEKRADFLEMVTKAKGNELLDLKVVVTDLCQKGGQ